MSLQEQNTTKRGSMCHERKCIFIHIPKNGGTSVYEALGLDKSLHYTYRHYENLFPTEWDTYFKFTIIRNPWARLVSSYEYAKQDISYWHNNIKPTIKTPPHPDHELIKRISFKEAVRLLYRDVHKHYPNVLRHAGWLPQMHWIKKNDEITVNKMYKIEDLGKLEKRFDIKLPVVNKTPTVDFRSYYDDETLEMVNHIYEDDIQTLKYSFL